MIHSKNFHSLIMPNSFFPFILQNVKNVAEIFHWHLIHMSFSQYFNTIWIYFFHNCQAALCLASSLFRAFFIFSFLRTQGSLLPLSSSRTHVRLGAWFWSAKADIFFSESLHILHFVPVGTKPLSTGQCVPSRSVYLSRRLYSHWERLVITHHLQKWESSPTKIKPVKWIRLQILYAACSSLRIPYSLI